MQNAQTSLEPDDLTLRVLVDDDLTLRLWDIRVVGRDVSNTLSFPKRDSLQKALVMPLGLQVARHLSDFLHRDFRERGTALELPDFKLHLTGSLLSGLRIERARGITKSQVYALRFKHFIGRVESLFTADRAPSKDLLTHVDRVAVATLVDVAGPLFGLARMSEAARDEALRYLAAADGGNNGAAPSAQAGPVSLDHCLEHLTALQNQIGDIERHLRVLTEFAFHAEDRKKTQTALAKSVQHPDTLRDHVAAVAASPNVVSLRPRAKDT